MIKNAFICWRPFQVLTVANLILNEFDGTKEAINDLYLLNTKPLKKLINGVISSRLFDQVYCFDDAETKGNKNSSLMSMLQYLFPRTTIRKALAGKSNIPKYDVLYASGGHVFFICMCEVNKVAEVIFFDDGFGSYVREMDVKNYSTLKNKLFYAIAGKGRLSIKIKKQLLYRSDWALHNICLKEKISEFSKEGLNCCKKIFGFQELGLYSKANIVYLDQDYTALDAFNSRYSKTEIVECLSGKGKVVVRRHPAQKEELKIQCTYDNGDNMWELEAGGLTESTILVSINSSATVTPYFFYGAQPPIILLYKLAFLKGTVAYRVSDEIGEIITRYYPGKKYIPETYHDLECVLDKLI